MKTKQNIPMPLVAMERRPVFTRDWNISQQFAHWLIARNVPPNAISLAGMAGGIVAGLALAATHLPPWTQVLFLLAAAAVVVRGMGNLLDGMVAVGTGKASPFGELFNEIPDRVADIAILIGAGYAAGGTPALGFIAALVAVFVAYVRAEGKVTGAKQHYCGPMAKPGRMVVVLLISLYCGLTPTSWQPAVQIENQSFGLMALGLVVIVFGGIITAFRRLQRIAGEVSRSYPLKK
ncbi:MAG TPA: CDP-alcohol phosphatidyltransferase family protein [Verrucomicrobiae bacterium]|nr:CDP-alcohol phosphatidyltransferase family protein [Verrucomicrobiae bacterium]